MVLDLGHRPAFGREDFLVATCNEEAVRWLDRWPHWPTQGLALYGPPGCGKSHLAEVWRARSGAVRLTAGSLGGYDPAAMPAAARGCVIEDIGGGEALEERALLHLYNLAGEFGGHILFTGVTPPAHWRIALPDLMSRLRAMPAVALRPPDDALLGAVLVKLFADRQLRVGPDVIAFVLARMERSFAGARALAAALDGAALAERRRITVPLARRVLTELAPADEG